MTDRIELTAALDALLQPERFKDYCPNGLQVEGRLPVRKLVSGVTASLALIEAAINAKADAILVHHGLFWRGHDGRVTGWMKQRLQALLAADINLYAYHLPMDAHPTLGNNAQLAKQLGWEPTEGSAGVFGEQDLGRLAAVNYTDASELAQHLKLTLKTHVTAIQASSIAIKKIAWCTGGAQSYFEAAIAAGADAFVTGEISEAQTHYAREMGVAYLACGHHATESFGAPAVGEYIAQVLGVVHEFIHIDNPA
ncbi:MAG: Nif3-like dinuclear metal center hexameric protein [Betaproteobacteria bacterium]|nr:Nif3-like dinuclear metal center hexameric protein [Betaproteobacteria bacterium]